MSEVGKEHMWATLFAAISAGSYGLLGHVGMSTIFAGFLVITHCAQMIVEAIKGERVDISVEHPAPHLGLNE